MMRFSPPTEITPEPTPEFVLNYDASCLPNVTPPENIIESGNGESLNLVAIPPMEGEFSLLETGTMQQSQSNIIFLEVDTTLDDANLNACTTAESDCSLRGAVEKAYDNLTQHHVISKSNVYGADDPWWWGNYGYGTTEYEQLKTQGHPNMVYCIIVRLFNDSGSVQSRVDSEDFWTDYIFVLINTTSIGQTSNYNREFIPSWVQNAIDSQTLPNPQYEICP